MSDLRQRIHVRRSKHKRLMSKAQADIETSKFHVDQANYYSKGMSTYYKDAARSHAMSGWEYVNHAIEHVVECGCPSTSWPEEVSNAIPG